MKLIAFGLLGTIAIGLSAAEGKPELKDQKDKVSYSIGMDIGRNIKRQQLDVNVDALAAGIKDIMAGGTTALTEEQAREVMTAYRTEMQAKQQTQAKEAGEKNKKEGAAFLAENKKKEGVKTHTVTLPQGGAAELQYKVLVQGTGPKPSTNDTVTTHYRGTLIDGKEFDSSYKRGEPMSFPVTGVIKGWTEALLMMPVGSKWQLFIPSELGYGERGAGRDIGPNATLLFDIELIGIGEKPKAAESK
ncbi:MAG: FKBP-type peptidyl-prolyl cis-trans isomerase [Verrucomicrobia subdivision 3 bacterium]|nr:FKBP-type peptidyl-prolyl cis-trans isomerase [Limisphaerales bacterium]